MISRSVQISIAGGGGEMFRACLVVVFFFFFLFCNNELFVSRYKQPGVARAMKSKKTINANHRPFHFFMGKFKQPVSIGKVFPA